MAMLLIFNALKSSLSIDISVRHFEHGIRGEESIRDARFVEKLCKRLGVDFWVENGDVPRLAKERGWSLEEAARNLRYEFLLNAEEKFIATAHNAMDNAETILFNLVRGSGIGGLTGISPIRKQGEKTIIRPILNLTREEILDYLNEKNQEYCVDKTNSELDYSRNRIRKEVIPALVKVNSNAINHINLAGKNLSIYRDYENEITKKALKGVSDSLDISLLEDYSTEISKAIVFKFITDFCGARDIGRIHVESVMSLIKRGESGKQVDIPGYVVKREYERIKIVPRNSETKVSAGMAKYEEVSRKIVDLESDSFKKSDIIQGNYPKDRYTKWLDYDKMVGDCCYRTPREGDYITIKDGEGNLKKKSFNRYCIDAKIPREERVNMQLLCCDSHIVWVLGDRISEAFKVTEHTKTLICITVKERCGV